MRFCGRQQRRTLFLLFLFNASLANLHAEKPSGSALSGQSTREKGMRILGPFLSRDDQDEYTKVVLKNGLTAIIYERKDLPLVAISTYSKVGYLEEQDSQRGISHVLEHMFFKGTQNRGVGQIATQTKALGGYLNASTSYEYTHYFVVLPSEHFIQGLEIQADALQNPLFAEEELKKEVQVILQEGFGKSDSPDAYAIEKLYEIAFDVSPVRRWRIGDETTLLLLSRAEIKSFHDRWYVPSNIVLVICGNIDRRTALDEIVKRYSAMRGSALESPPIPRDPPQSKLRYRQMRGAVAQPRALFGFAGPQPFSKDWYAFELLTQALVGGESSILNRQLKQDQSLVTSVSAIWLDLAHQAHVTFQLNLASENLEAAEIGFFAELEKIKSAGLEPQDTERAKNLLELKNYQSREELANLSLQLAQYEASASYREFRDRVSKSRAVTSDQLLRVARAYLNIHQCSLLEYVPQRAPARNVTLESLTAALAQRAHTITQPEERSPQQQMPQEREATTSQDKPNPPVSGVPGRPKVEISSAWVDSPLKEYPILRGPTVLVKESRALPLISIGVFFPGGRVFEGPANNGITQLMMRASIRGTLKMDAGMVVTSLEGSGATLEIYVEPDFCGYVLTGLRSNFQKALDTLLAVIREPRFDVRELEQEKVFLLAEARRRLDDQVLHSKDLFKRASYQEHPYGLPSLGTPESIMRLRREDIQEWHAQFIQNTAPVIAIAGNSEGSELVALMSSQFSSSTAQPIDLSVALPVKPVERFKEQVEALQKQQSATVLGFLTVGVSEPETRVLTVLAGLLSGLGGRLFNEVPEKQALAYTVSTSYETLALGGCFTTYVATSPKNRLPAIESVKEQIRKLSVNLMSNEEVSRGRNFASASWKFRLQRRNFQVFEYCRLKMLGLSVDEISHYSDQFEAVQPDMIREVCQKFLDLNHLAIGGTLGEVKQ